MKKSITITGALGSGKSTTARRLGELTGYTYYSTGTAQRHIAEQMGITTLELNLLSDKNPTIDEKIDSVFKKMNNDGASYIVDSRLAWHFMPDSFKVKLIADKKTAAERIMNDTTRTGERKYNSVDEALAAITERRQSEASRFLHTYHVDIENNEAFDLILDTTSLTPEQVCAKILQEYNAQKA